MEFRHVSVLYGQVIELLNVRPEGVYADGTLGGGGHARGICDRLSASGTFVGIDRDTDALDAAAGRLEGTACAKHLVQSDYEDIKPVLSSLGIERVDGALLDLGVSSFQLDNPERGFSYMQDAPLDMRMDRTGSLTARDVVNGYSEEELRRIIKDYGEERWASRIASSIASARRKAPVDTTGELVEIIKKAVPAAVRRDGPHPAKRTFQAIRIEVNDELGQLQRVLGDFMDVLAPGGRLAVISFHSLEDRIVKDAFNARLNPCTCPPDLPLCVCGKKPDIAKVTGKPVTADEAELEANPRSRSAKLRVVEKVMT